MRGSRFGFQQPISVIGESFRVTNPSPAWMTAKAPGASLWDDRYRRLAFAAATHLAYNSDDARLMMTYEE